MTCRKCRSVGVRMYISQGRLWCGACHVDATDMWIRR
nr:MAG TPA: Ribosome, EUKARYOTIC, KINETOPLASTIDS, EXPANSION SEGMENTS.57A [Caudoviricetes sp.]